MNINDPEHKHERMLRNLENFQEISSSESLNLLKVMSLLLQLGVNLFL